MSVNLSPLGGAAAQFFTNNGVPLAGGFLYSYLAGTNTPAAVYTTSAGNVAHSNPIEFDSAGRVPSGEVWLTEGTSYKFILRDSANNLIGTYDDITGIQNNVFVPDAELVVYTPPFTGGVATNVEKKLSQYVSVFDFMTAAEIADVQAETMLIDVTSKIQAALDSEQVVFMPPGAYKVTDTILVGSRGKGLIGFNPNRRVQTPGSYTLIKYDGPVNKMKTVIQLGPNAVGADPTVDCTSNVLQNVIIDASYKAGFCVYGTYVVNESWVDNITVQNSTEFNAYFAFAYYATFTNIFSNYGRGKGLAFGMPLILQDGTNLSGSWSVSTEVNQCEINNIRSIFDGQYFSALFPNTWNPTNAGMRMQGYGIGAGLGNGFTMTNFLSEAAGGTGLYVYSGPQPRKTIQYGYLEANNENSGLNATTQKCSIILENTASASGIEVRDIFSNFNGGGIYHVGNTSGTTNLRNIHEPRFLKSLDGVTEEVLFSCVLKTNVRFECGFYNLNQALMSGIGYGVVNTRYSFTVDLQPGVYPVIYMKSDGNPLYGSWFLNFADGTSFNGDFSTVTTSFKLIYVGDANNPISITKGGGTGPTDNALTIMVKSTIATFL